VTVPELLVGRDAVLATARATLDDALAGTTQLLLVTGEPGIGKTAVLSRVAADAAQRGATVLRATCWDGGAPPYWPWIQILRAVPEVELGPAAEPAEPAELTGLLAGPGETARSGADAADARFRLFDATATLLTRLSRTDGLVVVLDDLQWADDASLRLLEFLGRHLGAAPVLLLGAYRELDAGSSGLGQVLPLGGLDEAGVAAVMTAVAGPRPDRELARRVWRRSGGNPLFVRELTRLVQAGAGEVVPETVRDILRSRLARLSQPCAELLAIAAACGRTVRPELLGRLTEVSADALDEATSARVLTRTEDGLRFSHDLYRETLLGELPAAGRAALHAAAGHALADLRAAGVPVADSEVAAQFLAAGPDSAADAARACALAGAESARRAAHADAAAHYRDALAALDLVAVDPAAGTPELPDRRELLALLAEALDHAGHAGDARAVYRDLADLARRRADPTALAQAALGLHGLGFRSGGVDDALLHLLSEVADRLPPDARTLRSRVLTALGRDLRQGPGPDGDRAAAVVREARALAEDAGDPATLTLALLAQHDLAWRPGSAAERLAIVADMASAAELAGDPDLRAQAVLLRATALIELGDPDGVAALHAYTRLADGLGHARGRWGARSRRATLALIDGRADDAIAHASAALELGVLIGQPDAIAVHGTLLLSLGLLRPAAPAVPVIEIDPADPVASVLPLLRAAGMLAAGEPELARAEFRGFSVNTLPVQPHLEMLALAAATAAAVGSTEQREQAHARLAGHAGQHVVVGGCASYSGAVDHHLGLLHAALDQPADAIKHLEAAAAQYDRLGAPTWAEHARTELARLPGTPSCVFHQDGPVWTIEYQGRRALLPHSKGLSDIATLLAAPHTETHAAKLLGQPAPMTGADPILDDTARRAYRTRIEQLDTAIAAATTDAEAQRHETERAALVHEITAAAGLGHRPRRLGADTERARKAVTARIRDAIDRILAVDPDLGLHLRATIHTGTHCSYRPTDETRWRL
jgi:tetratricopeptide (TPR) repeat protein